MNDRKQIESLRKDKEWVHTFMGKLKKPRKKDGCWEWTGSTDRSGYGRLHVKKYAAKKTGRNFFAHRMCYMIHRGYITPDEFILHQCHNRLCCNPNHHKLGDHYDNMDDLSKSGRVHGENNHRSTVTEDDVFEILALYNFGDIDSEHLPYSIRELSNEYDMPVGTLKDIVGGRTWRHVYDEFWEDER